MRNASPRSVESRADKPGRHAKPGRHRKVGSRARLRGLPLVPTLGVAGDQRERAGGSAAAATGGPETSHRSTTLASGTGSTVSQDAARAAATERADRTRTDRASAGAKAKTAAQRAAWLEKTAASQRALARKQSAALVADKNEVDLTASTLASKKAAAIKAAAKAEAGKVAAVTGVSVSGRYVLPVSSGVNRDTFGMTGAHWANRHTGQDFPVPLGTGVRAVSSGKVLETGWAGAFGNRMKLLLDDGTEIWYCHLSSYVVTGGRVTAGEVVARSGSTGNSTGPHLHMEVHLKQNPVASDPLNWLRSKGLKL